MGTQQKKQYATAVKVWLGVGLFMIFMQVVIGGVTRLTGSGLSITKWEIVTGSIPPLNAHAWDEAFALYRATPQYEKINQDMTIGEFKFIYFWEYFHRLWARLMGFVFIIPLGIFLARGMVDKVLLRRLGVVFLLAALVASFGWVMVASGLVNRPWVNAYKLTMHLSLALLLYSYLLWVTFRAVQPGKQGINNILLKRGALAIALVAAVQIILGGIMSGMKAGLFFPTWPDMNGEWVPSVLLKASNWNVDNFVEYDAHLFMPALIQLLHRSMAYLLVALVLWFFYKSTRQKAARPPRLPLYLLVSMLIIQALLGIFTLINCVGAVPVGLGVMHQAGAILFLSVTLYVNYQFIGDRN
ncbi:MAG: COX15/CtaA family protein [Lewinellaceae bacterium]|nr:COX15/CtaA family protein [Lewinellaceae bacterium]